MNCTTTILTPLEISSESVSICRAERRHAGHQISPMYNNGKSRCALNPDSRTPGVADRYPSTPDLTLREHKDNSWDFGNDDVSGSESNENSRHSFSKRAGYFRLLE